MREAKIQKSRGMSLIEVLISLCILSVGLLGLARTQILALQESRLAYTQSVSTQQAQNQYEETLK